MVEASHYATRFFLLDFKADFLPRYLNPRSYALICQDSTCMKRLDTVVNISLRPLLHSPSRGTERLDVGHIFWLASIRLLSPGLPVFRRIIVAVCSTPCDRTEHSMDVEV
jgi:hypothetical protein